MNIHCNNDYTDGWQSSSLEEKILSYIADFCRLQRLNVRQILTYKQLQTLSFQLQQTGSNRTLRVNATLCAWNAMTSSCSRTLLTMSPTHSSVWIKNTNASACTSNQKGSPFLRGTQNFAPSHGIMLSAMEFLLFVKFAEFDKTIGEWRYHLLAHIWAQNTKAQVTKTLSNSSEDCGCHVLLFASIGPSCAYQLEV